MNAVSSSPPLRVIDGSTWHNPLNKTNYKSDIYHKIWVGHNREIAMPQGTVYHQIKTGNEYLLKNNMWDIIKLGANSSMNKDRT